MSIDGMRADRDPDGTADGAGHADQGDGRQPRTDAPRPEKLRRKFFDAENVGDFLDAEKKAPRPCRTCSHRRSTPARTR
jgi:hypothetical protein